MKRYKFISLLMAVSMTASAWLGVAPTVFAEEGTEETTEEGEVEDLRIIPDGISIEGTDVSGMTVSEAKDVIDSFYDIYDDVEFVLSANGKTVTVTGDELAIGAKNSDAPAKAASYGTYGNVAERFIATKELENGLVSKNYKLSISCDPLGLSNCLLEAAWKLDDEASDNTLKRVDGEFVYVDGVAGDVVNVDEAAEIITSYIENDWDGQGTTFELPTITQEPRGSKEELATITDLLGSFTTSYASSSANRKANVANGVSFINGTVLYPGDEFSVLKTIQPFTEANGYRLAGSYANGTVVETFGGGICQVSTTLYGAVRQAEVEVVTRSCHSMIIDYVPPSQDAAIAESGAKDFQIKNNRETPIYLEGYCDGSYVHFNIYGQETRENRKVEYETEVLEVTPQPTTWWPDTEMACGTMRQTTSGHTGYKARLWKIVYENGAEVDRYVYNNSKYQVQNREVHVGIAGASEDVANRIIAACATGDPIVVATTMGELGYAVTVPLIITPKYQVTAQEEAASAEELADLETPATE